MGACILQKTKLDQPHLTAGHIHLRTAEILLARKPVDWIYIYHKVGATTRTGKFVCLRLFVFLELHAFAVQLNRIAIQSAQRAYIIL